jgi:alcohol dehydrogenase class IV
MQDILNRLNAIKIKAEEILSENRLLKQSLKKQEDQIERLKKLIEIQNNTLKEQEQKLKIKEIVESALEDRELGANKKRELKAKINEMIKEVDKVIHLMNQ